MIQLNIFRVKFELGLTKSIPCSLCIGKVTIQINPPIQVSSDGIHQVWIKLPSLFKSIYANTRANYPEISQILKGLLQENHLFTD